MSSGNEIVFFGNRNTWSQKKQSVIVYNDISKKYTLLRDDQNYKSIGLYGYSVFKCNNNYNISGNSTEREEKKEFKEEYISFDGCGHFSIYNYNVKSSHEIKNFTTVNKMNNDFGILSHSLCFSLFNRNGTYISIYLFHL